MGVSAWSPPLTFVRLRPLTQDAVFGEEIGDDLLLVTLEPPSNHGDQDVEELSYS